MGIVLNRPPLQVFYRGMGSMRNFRLRMDHPAEKEDWKKARN